MLVLVASGAFAACDETTEPDCRDGQCTPVDDAGQPVDSAAPAPPADDGAVIAPLPFDSGSTLPAPACKGLFELCSGQECCSPYGCNNGTCR
jgi:hypothetical protein